MQFKFLTIVTAVLSASSVQAQLSAQDVIKNIKEVTSLSKSTNDIAQNLSPASAPKLITNFRDIIMTVGKDVEAMSKGKADYKTDDQTGICNAFRDFVEVHQALLNTVIGKAGILSHTPFTAVIGGVLRTVESGVDKLAFGLIDAVPTCADKAKSDKKALDGTLDKAIDKFSFKLF